jgi:Raf kinase inhibitor-like YbhB/YbcL family protein
MLENLPEAVGRMLWHQRAGLDQTLFHRVHLSEGMGVIEVSSWAFDNFKPIPTVYTADGEGRSPPLAWEGLPASATEVVVIVEDADAPTPHPLVHGIVAGLPGEDASLAEAAMSGKDASEGEVGRNSFLLSRWLPPDPPPGHGPHRYVFQVFALRPGAPIPASPRREDVERAVRTRAVASGRLIGVYQRSDGTVEESARAAVIAPTKPAL